MAPSRYFGATAPGYHRSLSLACVTTRDAPFLVEEETPALLAASRDTAVVVLCPTLVVVFMVVVA